MENDAVVINSNSCIKQQKGTVLVDRFYNVCTGKVTEVPWSMPALVGQWIGSFMAVVLIGIGFYWLVKTMKGLDNHDTIGK